MQCVTVKELASSMKMEIYTGAAGMDRKVQGGYCGDLLSWVMSHASTGDAWVTVLTNINTIAVAVLTEIPCIILPEGIQPEEAVIRKAVEENIAILGTDKTTFEVCWRLSALWKDE